MTDARQVKVPGPRELMPNVARLVDAKRVEWGSEHVKQCITRGMAGIPGWFYAFENGMVQGTPFDADQTTMDVLRLAVSLRGSCAMVMRPPKAEVQHGAP